MVSLVAEEGSFHGVRTFVVLIDIQESQKFEGLCCINWSPGPSECSVMLSIAFD